ncbi:MAG: hypothetical protein JO104_08200, partial [Candidatus Eremiobacteraeota bacterium]|nr:hypothetical protein [Candidatus Eremiobacteraeota bacterium]
MLISTIIVVGAAVVVTGWTNRDLITIKIASVYARIPPKPGAATTFATQSPGALRGDAPWALSALPECLVQTSKSTGPQPYVRSRLPAAAVRIVPPATLVYGDCSIRIAGNEAFVRRGADRLRIPPFVQFYRAEGFLVLIREMPGSAELRIYQP